MADSIGSGFPNTGINKGHLFFDQDEGALWEYINGPPRIVSSWKLLSGKFSEQPDTSLWGEVQAGATWFLTSDRTPYIWDGVQIVKMAIGNNVSLYDYHTSVKIQDDFGNGVGGFLGFTNTGTATVQASEANRYGVTRRDTTAVINSIATARLNSNSANSLHGSFNYQLLWVVRLNNIDADTYAKFGASNPFTTVAAAGGIYFEKNLVSPNWICVTRSGGIETPTDSGVLITTGFVTLSYTRIDGVVMFYINDVLVATNTTNIPGSQLVPEALITNNVAASKTFDIDYFLLDIFNLQR